jgi:hypothetical protein
MIKSSLLPLRMRMGMGMGIRIRISITTLYSDKANHFRKNSVG